MRAVNLIPSDQRRTVSAAGRSGGGAYAVLAVLGGFAILAFLYGQAHRQVSDRTSRVASLTSTSPPPAAEHRRAATLTALPYQSPSRETAGPVCTPIPMRNGVSPRV